jgi:7-cyano-7-deazaguanine reductase
MIAPSVNSAPMGTIPDSPLGKATHYPESYDAGLLYSVDRAPQRHALGIGESLPFVGVDRWTAWELTWLDLSGRVQVAIATFGVPCTSPRIVESKSVKLWLASLYNERLDSAVTVRESMVRDLSAATGAAVEVELDLPDTWERYARREAEGAPLDDELPAAFPSFPDASLLRAGGANADESLVSRTFRSVCPVTGQPDYACVTLHYRGPRIDRPALVAYLSGYRRHPGFHEHCVERIFVDLQRACAPDRLAVDARFTRRGGVDINPFRTSDATFRWPGGPAHRQ